jgi:hypothetical protein
MDSLMREALSPNLAYHTFSGTNRNRNRVKYQGMTSAKMLQTISFVLRSWYYKIN